VDPVVAVLVGPVDDPVVVGVGGREDAVGLVGGGAVALDDVVEGGAHDRGRALLQEVDARGDVGARRLADVVDLVGLDPVAVGAC
jgi:hypothetical protein